MGSRGRRVMILFRLLLGIYAIGDSDKPRKGEKKREGAKSACLRNPISVLSVPSDRLDRGQREAGSDGGIHFYFFIRQRSTCLPFMIVWLLHQFTNFPNAVCPVRFLISWCSFLSPSRSFFPSVLSSSLPPFSFVSVFSGSLLVAAERIFLCAPLERLDRGFHGNLEIVTRQARPPLQRATSRWIAEIFRSTFIEWKNLYQLCCSSYVSRLRIKFKAEISCPFPLELVWNVCCVNRIMPFDHLHRYFHAHKYPSEGSEETLYNKDMDHKKENKKKTTALLVKWQSFFVHRLDLPIC